MKPLPDCDLFCRVIDNYGDIGVCWRLARQLHNEHGWQVRLWVDDMQTCAQLMLGQPIAGVEIQPWHADFPATIQPAAIVIEAFACELPESYILAMAVAAQPPIWINLEYLCVEDWGSAFHLQPSPHPRLSLTKHFFVPGVLAGTGGVLKEADLRAQRVRFDVLNARRHYAEDIRGRWVFLFCYDNPALPALLSAWQNGEETVHCLVSAGKATTQALACLGENKAGVSDAGGSIQRGQLYLHFLPFVAQENFDTLLWTCDLNLIRGEDSFCRAQWAALPFVWHIYPQQEAAHQYKLAAFYKHYQPPQDAATALAGFSQLWNGTAAPAPADIGQAWLALDANLPNLKTYADSWQKHLDSLGNLAANLVFFCKNH